MKNNLSIYSALFFGVVALGVVATLFIGLQNDDGIIVNFSQIMKVVENAPNVFAGFSIPDIEIGSNWGIFNFLRDFINTSISMVSYGAFLATNLIQIILYIGYFLGAIFLI